MAKIKRPRTKGLAACTQCRTRRSKCDLIDELGCHRCKQLDSQCSFRGVNVSAERPRESVISTVIPSSPTNRNDENGQTVTALAEKIAALERQLSDVQRTVALSSGTCEPDTYISGPAFDYSISTGPSSSEPNPLPSVHDTSPATNLQRQSIPVESRKKESDRDETWFRTWADPEKFGLINRGMQGKEEMGLRDPIVEGIVSESQAEIMYQL